MSEVVRLPEWQSVAGRIAEMNPAPGTVFSHDWLCSAFGIQEASTIDEYKRNSLEFLRCIEGLKDALLMDHKIALRNVHGEGYAVMPPNEQTAYGVRVGLRGVEKSLKQMRKVITNVSLDKLTDEEVRKNTDAQIHAAGVASLLRSSRLIEFKK